MLNKCPLCESYNIQDFYIIKGYEIVQCKDCSFVFVKNEIPKEELVNLYTKTYFHNPAWYRLDKNRYLGYDDYIGDKANIRNKFEKVIKVIKRYTDNGPLLDIGCGPGLFLELAKERGFTPVKGIDISPYAVDYCINTLKLNVQNGDLLDFKFGSRTFNLITMFDVIEHVQNPKEELTEINRILKDNGILAIITPDIDALAVKLVKSKWEEIQRVPEHLVFFSKKTITYILRQTGFEILSTKYISKKQSFPSFISHLLVNAGINKKLDLNRIPKLRLNIPVNPFYKLLVIAKKL
jgi:2-polyprenyl-3-methyl-5-hydroxy-6-metoxy-1,4-benzoquinol methylase